MEFTKIKQAVYGRGWCVASIARALGVGLPYISGVLSGDPRYPGMQKKIAELLGVPGRRLFGAAWVGGRAHGNCRSRKAG